MNLTVQAHLRVNPKTKKRVCKIKESKTRISKLRRSRIRVKRNSSNSNRINFILLTRESDSKLINRELKINHKTKVAVPI